MRCFLIHVQVGGNHIGLSVCGLKPLYAVSAPIVKSAFVLYRYHVLMRSRQDHSDNTDLVVGNLAFDTCRVQSIGNRLVSIVNVIGVFD